MMQSEHSYNNLITKLSSYVGFAKKSRKINFGADKVLESCKNNVIIVSSDISSNTLNKLNNYAIKQNVSLVQIEDVVMCEITHSDRIKVFQIVDHNLELAAIDIINSLTKMEDNTVE